MTLLPASADSEPDRSGQSNRNGLAPAVDLGDPGCPVVHEDRLSGSEPTGDVM
jgi:hypothetical protein